jgi:cobalamin biosynthesis Mg chelatase CobN
MEEVELKNFSLSDAPISAENIEKSISIFTEFSDNSDEKLTKKTKSAIDQAFQNISSVDVLSAVKQELRANQPNNIEPNTVGEYLYTKISQNSNEVNKETNSSNEKAMKSENQKSGSDNSEVHLYTKSEKGLERMREGASDIASVYCSGQKYSKLNKEEYDQLYQDGVRKVDILDSHNGKNYSKVSLSENTASTSSQSEDVDVDAGSRSPNVSNTSSPSSKTQGYTIEYTEENDEKKKDKKHPRKEKKAGGYGWIALLIIVIVIVLVLVAIVWACRRSSQRVEHSRPAAVEYRTPAVSMKYTEKEEYAVASHENSCSW